MVVLSSGSGAKSGVAVNLASMLLGGHRSDSDLYNLCPHAMTMELVAVPGAVV